MVGTVEVPGFANNVQVTIKDASGQTVKTIGLGDQEEGSINYQWDGIGNDGEQYTPGKYTIEAIASIGGQAESLAINTVVPVESVYMGKAGEPMRINTAGLGEIKLSAVKQIM